MILRVLSSIGYFSYIEKLIVHHWKDKHNPDFVKDTISLMPHLIPHHQINSPSSSYKQLTRETTYGTKHQAFGQLGIKHSGMFALA